MDSIDRLTDLFAECMRLRCLDVKVEGFELFAVHTVLNSEEDLELECAVSLDIMHHEIVWANDTADCEPGEHLTTSLPGLGFSSAPTKKVVRVSAATESDWDARAIIGV
jgi:hypothetical protein